MSVPFTIWLSSSDTNAHGANLGDKPNEVWRKLWQEQPTK
jgi:hypothetical protein